MEYTKVQRKDKTTEYTPEWTTDQTQTTDQTTDHTLPQYTECQRHLKLGIQRTVGVKLYVLLSLNTIIFKILIQISLF